MQRESWRVSKDNGFYWWDLRNDRIKEAQIRLFQSANLFWKGLIIEKHFITALHLYFDLVYVESEAEWNRLYARKEYEPLPIDCVNIRPRELNFISERLRMWMFIEGEAVWDCEDFHNQWSVLGEQDYSHVKLPGVGRDYIFRWGKYRNMSLEEVMRMKPDYILWAADTAGKFILSDELRREIQEQVDILSTKRGR